MNFQFGHGSKNKEATQGKQFFRKYSNPLFTVSSLVEVSMGHHLSVSKICRPICLGYHPFKGPYELGGKWGPRARAGEAGSQDQGPIFAVLGKGQQIKKYEKLFHNIV